VGAGCGQAFAGSGTRIGFQVGIAHRVDESKPFLGNDEVFAEMLFELALQQTMHLFHAASNRNWNARTRDLFAVLVAESPRDYATVPK
jgi:hypothetical protein